MLSTLITLYLSAKLNGTNTDIPFDSIPHRSAGIEILSLSPIPIKSAEVKVGLSAISALVIDVSSNKVLYEKNIDEKLQIASLTKIMTAVVVIEEVADLEKISVVPKEATLVQGSKVWLREGEKISYTQLLYAMLIASGNDAAMSAAINISGSEELFVQKMNDKALALGMKNTHFTNPHGLDDPENYSTAKDLSILAGYAIKKSFIRSIIDTKEMEFQSESGIAHKLISTNKLLGVDPEIKGLKTGSTLGAGENLIALAVNPYGNEIVTVILNSQARFSETQYLKNKIWETYVW